MMQLCSTIFRLARTASLVVSAAAVIPLPAIGGEFAWIRVNQVGYLPHDPKIAILSSDRPLSGKFHVGEFAADIGPDQGGWGPFAHNYRLNFSGVRDSGNYRVRFGEIASPQFAIGPDAYKDVPSKLLEFMRLQRCGDNPVTGKKCHQQDGFDTTTGEMVDTIGGWHDAADRLKHMITTSYCAAALFLAGAEDEARHGAALIKKIHPSPDVIYVQVGDDRDHQPPNTLWHDDQSDYGRGPGGPRAAWRATSKPEGPKYQNKSDGVANLAGRSAAAMALAGDVDTARSMYRLAQSKPGCAMSVPVKSKYYYGESTYKDDLEWAATELFIATKNREFLGEAIGYAREAGVNPWVGRDRHGHYEFFPYVNLAHWRLWPHVGVADQQELAGLYRTGLERVRERALKNPYRLGTPLVWCSTNDVVAFATEAALYEQMTGDTQFRELAAEARDWIFGRNPWGVSFVIGVPERGRNASRPHHLFYKLANHLPVGGLVDGPVYKDINDSLKFEPFGDDDLARFQSDAGIYHDAFADFSTNEPIIDGTVSLLLLLNVWNAAPPGNEVIREADGAIIRGDVETKKLALVFTGGDKAESTGPILDTLDERNIKAGFFVTGDFARNTELRPLLQRIVNEGHYLGPHSDSHPLYCDWKSRQKTLVTKEFFAADLSKNLAALRALGALPDGQPAYFIPPYEWYNREQVAWAREMGVTMINFTPGSGSNRDYAPEGDRAFVPSQTIYDDLLAYEKKDPHGLNGFLLLLHLGSGRKDPFHARLGPLCDELAHRGYQFERVDAVCNER